MDVGSGSFPTLVVSAKAIVEFAAMLALARFGVWVLCFGRVRSNVIYDGLRFLTKPIEFLGAIWLPDSAPARWRFCLGVAVLVLVWFALVWLKARVFGVYV